MSVNMVDHFLIFGTFGLTFSDSHQVVFLCYCVHLTVGINVGNVGHEKRGVDVFEVRIYLYGLAVGVHAQFLASDFGITATQVIIQLA